MNRHNTNNTALSLRICSYNVHGFNDTKCDYIRKLLNNHDIVLLQEHWMYESQFHIFQRKFPGISSYSISGMNDKIVTSGRGYGGCTILWKSSMTCVVIPCNLDNSRICAVTAKLEDTCLLLCSI